MTKEMTAKDILSAATVLLDVADRLQAKEEQRAVEIQTEQESKALTFDKLKGMSISEINQRWEEVSDFLGDKKHAKK